MISKYGSKKEEESREINSRMKRLKMKIQQRLWLLLVMIRQKILLMKPKRMSIIVNKMHAQIGYERTEVGYPYLYYFSTFTSL